MDPVTPSRPPVVVDISTIEQQKENIQPLASGRSAAQLASLSSLPRSGLGAKLAAEHKRYQTLIDALDVYQRQGTWIDGQDGLSLDEVAALAEDPLDIHHRYVRFVLDNYTAGASAASKLIPLLESSTRRFLSNKLYRNDPRYVRLWILYSKNMECPQDCFRFLFAKNIGDRIALLYEEYALFLEANGKRKQADQIYQLGIARDALPLERLENQYKLFQARMLVARDPSPLTAGLPESSTSSRPTLAGAGLGSTSTAPKPNGRSFAIFQDGAPGNQAGAELKENWEDLGTTSSRTRENTVDAKSWRGEVMHMSATVKTPLKLEIYRDETSAPAASEPAVAATDVFSRSIRGPSEAEVLRQNPFKYYSEADLSLRSIDPLENISSSKIAASSKKASRSKESDKRDTAKSGKEKVAIDLKAVYPEPGAELSFEEIRARKRTYRSDAETWNDWEHLSAWQAEVDLLQIRSYRVDADGLPLLFDQQSGVPLYRFLRPPSPVQTAAPRQHRPPSPTINTLRAEALVNDLFAQTLNFDRKALEQDDGETDTDEDDEEDEDNENAQFAWSQPGSSQAESSMVGTQESNPPFVPFSQSSSQSDSFAASQSSAVFDESTISQPSRALIELSEQAGDDEDFNTRRAAEPLAAKKLFVQEQHQQATVTRPAFTPSRPLAATPQDDEIFEDVFEVADSQPQLEESQDEYEDHEEPLVDERFHEQGSIGDGYAMGRKPFGANRYASFVDNMTPITERTAEYNTTGSVTTYSSLSTSQRSRRDSAFPITDAVQEEDEEEDASTEDDDEVGDRAFVAEDAGSDSSSTRDGSSSEDSDDDEVNAALASAHARRDSSQTESSFGSHLNLAALASSLPPIQANDASLPEGLTITGNQSGMNSAMTLVTDSTVTRTTGSVGGLMPNPCNPYEPESMATILALVPEPVLRHANARDLSNRSSNQLDGMQKVAKKRELSQKKKDQTGTIDDPWELELGDDLFSVREKLGEGAFGAVYRVVESKDDDADFDDDVDEEESLAVKIERPTNLWEFYLLNALHERLDERSRSSVVSARRLYAYEDESFLLLDYCDQGSLLDAVNKAHESGIAPPTAGATGLDEPVAMFFTIELLRTLAAFHRSGFIHGDLKIDNCLVRLEQVPGGSRNWSNEYDPTGESGWSSKGIKLIDFGRSIDTRLFGPGQRFVSTLKTDEFDCFEMRQGKPWSYEPDYFGAASIVHTLLFGRFIETKQVERETADRQTVPFHTINQNIRRYHQVELWTRLFDLLLNPRFFAREARKDQEVDGGWSALTDMMDDVRRDMEDWLVKNCEKSGRSLKGLIRKIEIFAMSG